VTGISASDVYETLDGQVTIDLWSDEAAGWMTRCPRPTCDTDRRFQVHELRQLVAEAGSKLFIALPKPEPRRRDGQRR
jgi:hypothetical protein